MKNYAFIIMLLLFVTSNLNGQTQTDSVKKTTVQKEWQVVKKESKDKTIGKTKDGRTIFEGPRGGRYYINPKGKKVYMKKD